jgi:type II secretory pathway pseudopilin PulG
LLATVALSVAALALVAAIVALFDLATGWGAARDGGRALLDAGREVGNVLAWPILKIMDGFFAALIWIRDLILGPPRPPVVGDQGDQGPSCVQLLMEQQGLTMQQALDQCNPKPHEWPEWVRTLVRILVLIPLVGLVLLITGLVFTRFRRKARPGEQKESAYQQGRLASDLRSLEQPRPAAPTFTSAGAHRPRAAPLRTFDDGTPGPRASRPRPLTRWPQRSTAPSTVRRPAASPPRSRCPLRRPPAPGGGPPPARRETLRGQN